MDNNKMDGRNAREYNEDMALAINNELDRLGWSSDTAPEGNTSLDAVPTDEAGVVAILDTQETSLFHSETLLRLLFEVQPPVTYDALWQAILPAMVAEA